MADMEVHEHIVVDGKTAKLQHPVLHHNVESLSHYIRKHDEYSNWDAKVWVEGEASSGELAPSFFGSQAQRRRWLRKNFFAIPGSPLLFFLYRYIFRLGFLDGIPGLIYCSLRAFTPSAIRKLLINALAATGLTDAAGEPAHVLPARFPQDLRDRRHHERPAAPHRPGHLRPQEHRHHDRVQGRLPGRGDRGPPGVHRPPRATRPSEEYRTPTDEEWDAFLAHFEKRKVSVGTCARAFASPCVHEHACVRCSLLRPDPAQRRKRVEVRSQ